MTRLYLVRHGQTEWNIEGRMQGSKDSPLTDLGIYQAKQLGKSLEKVNIDIVYSSSSERTMNTAKIIVGKRKINILPTDELKEMNFGFWEGMTFEVIKEQYQELYQTFWNTPHLLRDCPGESFEQLKNRLVGFVNKVIQQHEGKDILLVTHGVALKMIINTFKGLDIKDIFQGEILKPTSLTVVEVENNNYNIVKYGDIEHYNLQLEE